MLKSSEEALVFFAVSKLIPIVYSAVVEPKLDNTNVLFSGSVHSIMQYTLQIILHRSIHYV